MSWNLTTPHPIRFTSCQTFRKLLLRPKAPARADEFPNPGLLCDDGVDTSLNQTFEAYLGTNTCWMLAYESFFGTGSYPTPSKKTYQQLPKSYQSMKMEKWKKQHEQTCVTKLLEEAVFAFSRLTFVTLTTDGFWKKALKKGRSVAFSGKHVPIRQLIHSHGPGTVELAKDHTK